MYKALNLFKKKVFRLSTLSICMLKLFLLTRAELLNYKL